MEERAELIEHHQQYVVIGLDRHSGGLLMRFAYAAEVRRGLLGDRRVHAVLNPQIRPQYCHEPLLLLQMRGRQLSPWRISSSASS